MRSKICTLILIGLCFGFLVFHEALMQTIRPMFILLLVSFFLALGGAYLGFRKLENGSFNRFNITLYSVLIVFLASVVLNLLWSATEEGLIAYNLAVHGADDTGGRYFYPGNSGMGYARGLSQALDLAKDILFHSFLIGLLIGLPLSFIFDSKSAKKSTNP